MKRLVFLIVLIGSLGILSGCAPKLWELSLNPAYFPNVNPDAPGKRIPLPADLKEQLKVNVWTGEGTKPQLHWTDKDNLYLVIYSTADARKYLRMYLIIPSTGEVKLLDEATKEIVANKILSTWSYKTTDSKSGRFFRALMAQGGKGGMTYGYEATVENNNIKTLMKIRMDTSNNSRQFVMSRDDLPEISFTLFGLGDQYTDISPYISSFRVSPDGRQYLAFQYVLSQGYDMQMLNVDTKSWITLTKNLDGSNKPENLNSIINTWGVDVNPQWTNVAWLRSDRDENKNINNFWIDFVPFDKTCNAPAPCDIAAAWPPNAK